MVPSDCQNFPVENGLLGTMLDSATLASAALDHVKLGAGSVILWSSPGLPPEARSPGRARHPSRCRGWSARGGRSQQSL